MTNFTPAQKRAQTREVADLQQYLNDITEIWNKSGVRVNPPYYLGNRITRSTLHNAEQDLALAKAIRASMDEKGGVK